MPRVNFVSFTFLVAFGLGSFVGIALALLAVALATPTPKPTIIDAPGAGAVADAATLTATATPTEAATVTPTPVPVIRARSTLTVHIGPDDDYAVLGTLASGSEVTVKGRDSDSEWVAIDFPPGSSAQGWIPAQQVVGLSLVQIGDLEVLQATAIDTSPRSRSTPTSGGNNNSNDGGSSNDGGNNGGNNNGDAGGPPARTPTPRASSPTPTPTPSTIGPSDLSIAGVTMSSGGFIRIGVENLGPGAVPEVTVEVSAAGYADELLTAPVLLRAGDTVMLQTSSLQLNGPSLVIVTLDPAGTLADIDRSNNVLRIELAP